MTFFKYFGLISIFYMILLFGGWIYVDVTQFNETVFSSFRNSLYYIYENKIKSILFFIAVVIPQAVSLTYWDKKKLAKNNKSLCKLNK